MNHLRTLVLERATKASRTVTTTKELFVVDTTHCSRHALFRRGSFVLRTTREVLIEDYGDLQKAFAQEVVPHE